MKLSKREWILISATLIIAVAVLFLYYVYLPLKDDIKALEGQSKELSTQIEEAIQKQALVETLKEQLVALQEETDTSYEDVLKTWDEPEILLYIEETIKDLALKNKLENFGVLTSEGYLNGDINLNIVATYKDLITILGKLEEGKYFSTVETMNMTKKVDVVENIEENVEGNVEVDNEMKQLEINLVLRFYAIDYLKEYTEDYHFMKGKYSKTNIFE